MDDLPRRNAETVALALRLMQTNLEAQQKRIDGLVDTLSSFAERMNLLERRLAEQRIASMGRGPTT